MTTDYKPTDSSTWQTRYTKESLQWAGLGKNGGLILPILLVIAGVFLTIVMYLVVLLNSEEKTFNVTVVLGLGLALVFLPFLAIKYAFSQAVSLAQEFYKISRQQDVDINQLIKFKLLTPIPLSNFIKMFDKFPFITIKNADEFPDDHWARWFGGPALLVLYDGVAVYLERGNQFSRVVGPGLPAPAMEQHERIKAVVDLRPQIETEKIKAWTKDGVQIEADVQAEVQIFASEEARKRSVILEEGQGETNLLYPFDPEQVKKVVENVAVRSNTETKELSETNWHGAALGNITGRIKGYISGQSLDELLTKDENSPQLLSFQVSDNLLNDLRDNLAQNSGVYLIGLQVTNVKPTQEVIAKVLVEYWEEKRKQEEEIRKGEAEAESIRTTQNAYTIAYQEFVSMLLSQLDDTAGSKVDIESIKEASVILLTHVLEKNLNDPMLGSFAAREMLKTLDAVRDQFKD